MNQPFILARHPLVVGTVSQVPSSGTIIIGRAPQSGLGGGVTITEAYFISAAAGTTSHNIAVALFDMGSAGTSVVGTIAASMGGNGDLAAASTPKAFTITPPNGWLAAGNYLGLGMVVTGSGLAANPCYVEVKCVSGR